MGARCQGQVLHQERSDEVLQPSRELPIDCGLYKRINQVHPENRSDVSERNSQARNTPLIFRRTDWGKEGVVEDQADLIGKVGNDKEGERRENFPGQREARRRPPAQKREEEKKIFIPLTIRQVSQHRGNQSNGDHRQGKSGGVKVLTAVQIARHPESKVEREDIERKDR